MRDVAIPAFPRLSDRLGEIAVPALAITGDRIVPTEQSIRLSRELPDAELVLISEYGHLPQEERPEAFLSAVEDAVRYTAVQ
jgi:pimeloyl-ACP methyl ester carboxylesterase